MKAINQLPTVAHPRVFRVKRIEHRLQEFHEPVRAADLLRRTAP